MSDSPLSSNEPQVVGQTSVESAADDESPQNKSLIQRIMSLNVYEVMLVVSLLCIVSATVMLVGTILSNFSGLALPWLTDTGKI
ncbi:MAG TPA: hypothetical protein PKD54_00060 [Pirellulaceae bacterium]|nr:hypothetical protein [Pirellulaceae bacterium]